MKVEMAADFVDNNSSNSNSNSRRVTAKSGGGGQVQGQGQEPEQLPCPRCDSINTKFCYYNNYNFSQPRHFCKACRRYWTEGGTLRDIPVGGGDLKGTNNDNVGLCRSGGLGLGSNFVGDAGLSVLGRGVWGFAGMGDGDVAGGGVGSNSSDSGGDGATGIWNTWQFESGEDTITTGFVGGDCFSWPDLAISTPGNGLEI